MQTLTIFARQPIPGRTKTRLCPPFEPNTAAALYTCFLRDIVDVAAALTDVQPIIAYTPDSDPAFFADFVPTIPTQPQHGATLGERMDAAIRQVLLEWSLVARRSSLVLIGSDSPDLPVAHLHEAFTQLDAGADVVLGPASDGGYYLIGVREPQPRLLLDVPMSTPTVLTDTLAIARQLILRVHLLPVWHDVDTADDVQQLAERLRVAPHHIAPATRAFLASLSTV